MLGNCISGTCQPPSFGCGENFGGVKYDAGMYPVKALLQNEFALPAGNPLIFGSPYYQFDQFSGLCSPSKFSSTAPFLDIEESAWDGGPSDDEPASVLVPARTDLGQPLVGRAQDARQPVGELGGDRRAVAAAGLAGREHVVERRLGEGTAAHEQHGEQRRTQERGQVPRARGRGRRRRDGQDHGANDQRHHRREQREDRVMPWPCSESGSKPCRRRSVER